MKKKIFGILCVFMAILAMSHNTFAVEVSLNAVPIWSNYSPDMCFWTTQQTNCYTNSYINGNSDVTISIYQVSMTLPQGLNVTSGKTIAVFNMVLDNFQDNNSIDGVFLYERVLAGDGWGLLDTKAFSQGSGSYRIQIMLIAESSYTSQGGYQIELKNAYNAAELAFLKPGERISAAGASFYYLEGSGTQAIVNAINNNNSSTVIEQQGDAIVDAIEEAQAKEDEAVSNIEDQTPSDISSEGNTENQATTNLIGLFQSFITAISGVNMGNCNITLDFPSYAGGSRVVNICQNKDKAGNLIAVFSSLTLIVFYIPLALKLLSMIYNEIRSFTNG